MKCPFLNPKIILHVDSAHTLLLLYTCWGNNFCCNADLQYKEKSLCRSAGLGTVQEAAAH